MYLNEKNLYNETPNEELNNVVVKEKEKKEKRKKIIKILLIIFIVIFNLIPLIIDIIELIQRILKNYDLRISLVPQIVSYILLLYFAIYLYKHGDEKPDSCFNFLICIEGVAGIIMVYSIIMDIIYTIDSDGVKKYDNSMKIINTSRIIFFVIAIVYDIAISCILCYYF